MRARVCAVAKYIYILSKIKVKEIVFFGFDNNEMAAFEVFLLKIVTILSYHNENVNAMLG